MSPREKNEVGEGNECHHPAPTLWLFLRHRHIYQLPEAGNFQKPTRNNGKY